MIRNKGNLTISLVRLLTLLMLLPCRVLFVLYDDPCLLCPGISRVEQQ